MKKILGFSDIDVEIKIKNTCDQYKHVETFILISVTESAFDLTNITINCFNKFKKSSQSLVVIVDDFYRMVPGSWQSAETFYALHHAHGVNYWSKKTQTVWDSKSTDFLFLTGVADRLNRVGLLAKLYQKNLLDNSIFLFILRFLEAIWILNVI